MKSNPVKFIDLFAGLGGIRLGFEQAFQNAGFKTECVMTSEIKPYAIKTLKHNFSHEYLAGDIFEIHNEFIPDFAQDMMAQQMMQQQQMLMQQGAPQMDLPPNEAQPQGTM